MTTTHVSLTVNGRPVGAAAEPRRHLADFLREDLLLTGTHIGCEQGVCGACTLFVDGRPIRSCITPAVACQNTEVRTVEGFDDDALMQRLRAAFTRHHGLQCGFCTPGMLATAYDIVRRLPDADAARIRRELSGNLCRCTGYAGIVAAIEDVLANEPPAPAVVPLPRRTRQPDNAALQQHRYTVASDREAAPVQASSRDTLEALAQAGGPAGGVILKRSLHLDAPAESVWRVLSDVPAVVSCIPGASLEGTPQGELLQGRCIVAAGPMRATFRGSALLRLDPRQHSGRLAGQGRDRLTRSELTGTLDFRLAEVAQGGAQLDLSMVYRLKGPLAQFGRPALVEEIADQLLAEVTTNIAQKAKGAAVTSGAPLSALDLVAKALTRLFSRLLRLR
ncbi:2Fe-2S iron-sulfur cluster-binding protein [Pelagibius sp. 7325]|uniref:2Fe-2S iron-sulfur cluster-binding protein n=1 Tax=Pelagibius sp. 7325 TaxID=3131994 RepID=UPI0030EE23DA